MPTLANARGSLPDSNLSAADQPRNRTREVVVNPALERCVRPGDLVLDVGSGSGILSEAARLLAAGSVIGCDIDLDVRPPFVGSADAVRTASADLLVANISAAVVED